MDLNLFDLLIGWHTFYFCLVPLISKTENFTILFSSNFNTFSSISYFLFLFIFLIVLLILDKSWTKYKGKKMSIINVGLYLRESKQILSTKILVVLLIINLIISFAWYIPNVSVVSLFSEDVAEISRAAAIYGNVYRCCLTVLLVIFLKKWVKENTFDKKLSILCILYLLSLLLLPRRILTNYILYSIFFAYSLKPSLLSFKHLAICMLCMLFIFKVYFPFYNIMRFTSLSRNNSNVVENVVDLFSETINEYDNAVKNAEELTEGRTLGLFNALYKLIKYDNNPSYGQLTLSAFDYSMPSIINKNKGKGSEKVLEQKTHAYVDQADSVLLFAYGEFGCVLGAFYAVLLYLSLFLYVWLEKIVSNLLYTGSIIGIIICSTLFLLTYNLEHCFESIITGFITFIAFSFILYLLCKFRIISVSEKQTSLINHRQ